MKRTRINPISNKQQRLVAYRAMMKPIIFEAQGRKCKKCGCKTPDFRGWQLSHVIPLSKGGKDTVENLEVLCSKCHAIYRHNIKEV